MGEEVPVDETKYVSFRDSKLREGMQHIVRERAKGVVGGIRRKEVVEC